MKQRPLAIEFGFSSKLIRATSLLLFCLACMLNTATASSYAIEKLKPTGIWVGISLDNGKLAVSPQNGLITNEQEWASIWEQWHPGEPLPSIDFGKDVVLSSTVVGPNRMRLGKLVLVERRDGEGAVTFKPISTKRGGAGFGHILVQIPRRNVTSVNGVALPAGVPALVIADGVEVNIVGLVQTGVMAIGGETTGTTITAGNIVWELQNESGAADLFADFDRRRARVVGRLTRKAGVEVAERWIVLVEKICEPPIRIGARNDYGHEEVAIETDALDGFLSLALEQSGGIVGAIHSTTVEADGAISRPVAFGVGEAKMKMPRDRLVRLHRIVRGTDWAKVPQRTRSLNAADMFQFEVSIATSERTWHFSIDEASLDQVEPIKELIGLLR